MASRTASSKRVNARASLALILAICGALAVPAGIVVSQHAGGVVLLDAAYAIPVGMLVSVLALLASRGGHATIARTLERAGGHRRLRAAKWLAIAGICVALSGAIAVGFYELLLRFEK
jgi:uncharacterized membrane protein YfcA